jgi:hypothetical protein
MTGRRHHCCDFVLLTKPKGPGLTGRHGFIRQPPIVILPISIGDDFGSNIPGEAKSMRIRIYLASAEMKRFS